MGEPDNAREYFRRSVEVNHGHVAGVFVGDVVCCDWKLSLLPVPPSCVLLNVIGLEIRLSAHLAVNVLDFVYHGSIDGANLSGWPMKSLSATPYRKKVVKAVI